MEIIVKGEGKKKFKPDQIELNYTFTVREKEYEKVVDLGIKSVDSYLKLLEEMGFARSQVKTIQFRVEEEKKYNEKTKKYDFIGYRYIQSSKFKFEYNLEKLQEIIINSSKLNYVSYKINFTLQDEKRAQDELLTIAYEDAKKQAETISKVAGLKLIKCLKTSFEAFDGSFISPSRFNEAYLCMDKRTIGEDLGNIFIPEDISVEKNIYCIFLAE